MIDLEKTIKESELREYLSSQGSFNRNVSLNREHPHQEIMRQLGPYLTAHATYTGNDLILLCELSKGKKLLETEPLDYVSVGDQKDFEEVEAESFRKHRELEKVNNREYQTAKEEWERKYPKDQRENEETARLGRLSRVELERPRKRRISLPNIAGHLGILVDDYEHNEGFMESLKIYYKQSHDFQYTHHFLREEYELSPNQLQEIFYQVCEKYGLPKEGFEVGTNAASFIFMRKLSVEEFKSDSNALKAKMESLASAGNHFFNGLENRKERIAGERRANQNTEKRRLYQDFGLEE